MLCGLNQPQPKALDENWKSLINAAQWSWANTSTDGGVNYRVAVDVTDPASFERDAIMACRVLCLYYISRLNGTALIEARDSLQEVYEQQEASNYLVPTEPAMKRAESAGIRQLGKLW